MSQHFSDRLIERIRRIEAPICVGIDPILDLLPPGLPGDSGGVGDISDRVNRVFNFCQGVLEVATDEAACVKFQSAYFEQFLVEGVEAYYSLVSEAVDRGLPVIGDVKRGDIGSTAEAYARGHLEPVALEEDWRTPDAITVNPMLGMDTLAPFVETAKRYHKGLFVLVRTSNPGSAVLQDAMLQDGRTWSEMLADNVNEVAGDPSLVGESGYSLVGAVVGATQPAAMATLRKRLPRSILLLPGYGKQGATAQMTQAAFQNQTGAIVSASRSILYAHREPKYANRFGTDWKSCVRQAMRDMKDDLRPLVTKP